MSDLRFGDGVRRVVQLQKDSAGHTVAVEIYRKPGDARKKSSRPMRPIDKAIRRAAEAQQTTAATYLQKHEKSSAMRKDGWLRDLNANVWDATRKGQKALKLRRLILPW
jgi:hypothetical protein